jgi:tetraacyldisaccharide 4'-kinase
MKQPKFWQQKNLWSFLLLPFSLIYYLIISLRSFCYRSKIFRTRKFPVPVIVVGNITVGGVGKTPLVIWLIDFLRQHSFNPGVVSRGYCGRLNKRAILVTEDSNAYDVGDEPLMIVKRTACKMVISQNRCLAVKTLLAAASDCDIVISDDGLQHYALGRDIEIAVIDSGRLFGNGYLLPAGPLREPVKKLQSVGFVVENFGENKREASNGKYAMWFNTLFLQNLKNKEQKKDVTDFVGVSKIHAVAGVGNPQKFFNFLRKSGLRFEEHIFPDHYFYKPQDLSFGDDAIVIMTEKDAVKCRQLANDNFWFLRISAELEKRFGDDLLELLHRLG